MNNVRTQKTIEPNDRLSLNDWYKYIHSEVTNAVKLKKNEQRADFNKRVNY